MEKQALGLLVASLPTLNLARNSKELFLIVVDTPFLRPFHFNVNIPQVTTVPALIKSLDVFNVFNEYAQPIRHLA